MKPAAHSPKPPEEAVPYEPSFPIVGIGASAGGLEALSQLLRALPPDSGMGFVFVQHLDPDHESALTEILSRSTSLSVRVITDGDRVTPNHVHVIPRDTSLGIAGGVLELHPRARGPAPQRPIDVFFEALALDQGDRAIGVILSGTGNDGTQGLEAIKAEGGITFAQDGSAKYDGMPKSAAAAGCVDLVLSPADIAKELARLAIHPRVGEGESSDGYESVLLALRNHSGVDFSHYKPSTLGRRMNRRLVLNRKKSLPEYADFLRENANEVSALYADVLIGVTSFFRNPETFDFLRRRTLPELLRRDSDDPIRCWVLGCSTGQEAYSIAMALVEACEDAPRMRTLQIFATDLNEVGLEKARQGLYPKTIADEMSPERLRRFFSEENGGYQISKSLREMVVFARQNVLADPPFSRMDLISCRNLLIYLQSGLQQKVMPTFHFALRPHGFLLLGASESVSGFTHLFDAIDKKHKVFAKKPAANVHLSLPIRVPASESLPLAARRPKATDLFAEVPGETTARREADRISANKFAPPGVIVSADLQVLQFRGATGAYLESPAGRASFDLLKMARDGLMMPLRSAIALACKEGRAVRKVAKLTKKGASRNVTIDVIPLENSMETGFLILFGESQKSKPHEPKRTPKGQEQTRQREMEAELAELREYVQSLREAFEATSEEQQASNEEVQSANEELQSLNEEMETSKEELESANEELTTVNDEMSSRNLELGRLNDDLVNFQNSSRLCLVLLGRDLTIRRFSPRAEGQFDLLAADVGRPIGHLRHDLVRTDGSTLDLLAICSEVVSDVREQEMELRDGGGRWLSLRVRPYLTLDNKVDGASLVLVDITNVKMSDQAARRSEAQRAAIVEASDDAITSIDLRGVVQTWNAGAERLFGYTSGEVIGKPAVFLFPPDRVDEEAAILARVARGEAVERYETKRLCKDGKLVAVSLTVSPIRDTEGVVIGVARIARDIRQQKELEDVLRQRGADLMATDDRKNEFLAMLGHELRNPLSALTNALHLLGRVPQEPARVEPLREMMMRQTLRMRNLLDQLLDIARVISGKVVLADDRVELSDVIRSAVETVRSLSDTRRHTLAVSLPTEGDAIVRGDALRLTQVVENLLTNAVKYTDEGGSVSLTLQSGAEASRITVRDSGIGISPEFLPHVFEVFTQSPRSLDRAKGGLGLGLPLVKRLVEMHGGRVEARSGGVGKGSEFIVTLPGVHEERPPVGNAKPAQTELSEIPSRKILVVDDELDSAEVLAELLRRDGHRALAVGDGPAALEALSTFGPHVVLLDLGLPKMDGYEVARRMRQESGGKAALLIALTGYQNDARRLEEAGFDAHLIKPADVQKLAALLLDRTNRADGK